MTYERLKAWARAHGIEEYRVISATRIISRRQAEEMGLGHESRTEDEWICSDHASCYCEEPTPTREARIEEIERQRDTVLAECNPNLPTYEAK